MLSNPSSQTLRLDQPLCLQLPAGLFSAPSFAEGRQVKRCEFRHDYKKNVIRLHLCHF